jgi:hypothetical protein
MRKVVITQFAISLDGYICEEDTESCRPWWKMATDDELEEYLITRLPAPAPTSWAQPPTRTWPRTGPLHRAGRAGHEQHPRGRVLTALVKTRLGRMQYRPASSTASWPRPGST